MGFLINQTSIIGQAVISFTTNITGSVFVSLLFIFLFFLIFFALFKIPLPYILILMLPLLLVFMAYESSFLAIGGVILIVLGFIIAKNYFISGG